jgi:signal transduction histidine kinase
MRDDEAVKIKGFFAEAVANKRQIVDLENWNITKEGSEICLLTNGVPFFGKEGNLIGYRGADKDITDRKLAEQELANHRERLEELVEERTLQLKEAQEELIQGERLSTLGRLTATVSHELRNPLGTIQTALCSISANLGQSETHQTERSLELAERSINRCVNIIEDLTDYTRVKKLNLSMTSIDEWLKTLLEEQVFPEEIHCELNLTCGVRAPIDQERLRQVIVNLVTNAEHGLMDERSNGKLLQVSTRLCNSEYEVCVCDNGIGMSDETTKKIFEPLFSTKGFGVGLGMVISKTIVEQHHGKLSVKSKEEEGTTVCLRLPINLPEER